MVGAFRSGPLRRMAWRFLALCVVDYRSMADALSMSVLHRAWARGFRFLWVLDAVVLGTVLVGVSLVRFGTDWPTYPMSHYAVGFALAVLIQLVVNYGSGLFEREPLLGSFPMLPRVASAMVLGVVVDASLALIFDRYLMPRLHLGIFLVFGTAGLLANRRVSWKLGLTRRGHPQVALVGSVGSRSKVAARVGETPSGAQIVLELERVGELAGDLGGVTDVLLVDAQEFRSLSPESVNALAQRGVAVHQRIDAMTSMIGIRGVREIGGVPFVLVRSGLLRPYQRRIKRWMDLLIVVLLLPLWAAALGLTAAYVRVTAGRGVLYRQRRVGLEGAEFTMLKFRTMGRDAESTTGPILSARADPRVIPRLRLLRSLRLDELPQLVNVFRGEMSLVGPRPERPELVDRFRCAIPGYDLRHQTRPGLTGLAQLRGHYDTDPEHKLGYDLQYQVSWSLLQDFQILFATPVAMLRWRGQSRRSAQQQSSPLSTAGRSEVVGP